VPARIDIDAARLALGGKITDVSELARARRTAIGITVLPASALPIEVSAPVFVSTT